MPVKGGKVSVTELLKKKGAAKAFDAHKADETVLGGGGDLPAGIEGGIAQLTTAKLDVHSQDVKENKGEPYLMLAGIVKKPDEHVGSRVNILIGLYDKPRSKKTFEDQVATALNEMRKLGVDTSQLGGIDDWEDALAVLEQEAPFFRFRTWAGEPTKEFPNPRVNTQFRGLAKGFVDTDTTGGAVDDGTGETNPVPDENVIEGSQGGTDWAALAQLADDNQDEDAQAQLKAAGEEHGIDTDAYPTWAEAATAIAEAEAGGGGGDTGSDTGTVAGSVWEPAKGEMVKFKAKGARKEVEAEITAVFAKVLNLKTADDGKSHKSIPWTADPPTLNGHPVEV